MEVGHGTGAPRRRSCIRNGAGETFYEVNHEYDEDARRLPRPTLHMLLDQGSVGWVGAQWLVLFPHIRGTVDHDACHRRSNDGRAALQETGLLLVVLQWCTMMNMLCGPWQSNAFFGDLPGCVEDDAMVPSLKAVFSFLYEEVCRDRADDSPDLGSDAHFEKAFARMRATPILQRKGERVRMLRWFAWMRRAQEIIPHLNELLVVLLSVGISRRWWRSLADTPLLSSRRLEADDEGPDPQVDIAHDLVEPIPNPERRVGASAAPVGAAGPELKRQTMKGSQEEVTSLRSK